MATDGHLCIFTGYRVVPPSKTAVASALSDFGASTNFTNLLLGKTSPPPPPSQEPADDVMMTIVIVMMMVMMVGVPIF
jgi:hypothetical protein